MPTISIYEHQPIFVGESRKDVLHPNDDVIFEQKHYDGYWAEVILHAHKEGVFQAISIAEQYSSSVKEIDLWVKTGEHVYSFRGANNAIGTLALRFEIEKQMLEFISNVNQYVTIDIL